MTEQTNNARRIFDTRPGDTGQSVILPWSRTLRMCWSNLHHRIGRSMLTFICIAVVIAFLTASLTYQDIVGALSRQDDVHVKAVLEQAGITSADTAADTERRDQRIWLLSLSAVLCLVGITNTILMSVTERTREIGTLKCLGALDRFVVRLFLIESVFVGIVASAAGAAIGYLLAVLQAGAVLEYKLLSSAILFPALEHNFPIAVLIGTTLTVLGALYPTWKAARMKPVDAMRVEV